MKSLEPPCIFEYCHLPERAAIPTFSSSDASSIRRYLVNKWISSRGCKVPHPSSLYLTKADVLDNITPTDSGFGRGKS